jgi:cytochrome P450
MVVASELVFLALIAFPLLRAAVHPALRRAFPKTAAAIALCLLSGGAVATALGVWFPQLLHVVTLSAAAGVLYGLWRARPGYGRERRLPPGSLSPVPFNYLIDPFFFQKQIERHGWVFKANQFGIGAGPNPFRGLLQPVCCIDMKRGIRILHDYDRSLIPPPIPSSRFIPKKYLREMNTEDHTRYRLIFAAAFKKEVIDESKAFMAAHISAALRRLADECSLDGNRGVAPENFLLEMTFGIFVRCFHGILPEDARFERLRKLCEVIDLSNRNEGEVTRALEEFVQILSSEARDVRAGKAGRPSSFLMEMTRVEPNAFDDLTMARNFIYIMTASWIDAAGLVVWLFKELSDHPQWTGKVLQDLWKSGAVDAGEPLSVCCVRETLRLRQSEYLYRRVLDDIPVDDFVIPKGWLIRVCVRESHRDRRVFENPDEFDPARFRLSSYSRADYSTFGASRISCLGEYLTMTLGRIFVEELSRSVGVSVLRDGPLEYRRWHWKPSSKWRVRVMERAEERPAPAKGR